MSEVGEKYFVDAGGVYLGSFVGAEPPTGAVEVALPPVDGGQIWDGSAWGAAPYVAPVLSSLEFFALFEEDELAIEIAGETDAQIRIFLRRATGVDTIDMGSVKIIEGLDYLVTKGVITEARRNIVLAA